MVFADGLVQGQRREGFYLLHRPIPYRTTLGRSRPILRAHVPSGTELQRMYQKLPFGLLLLQVKATRRRA